MSDGGQLSIVWVGDGTALEARLLRAGAGGDVLVASDLAEAFSLRDSRTAGFVLADDRAEGALRSAELADGLARAVGWADCLAFAGNLPGAYGFCARVGGIVAGVRQAIGRRYLHCDAVILGPGPRARAALAALVELRASAISLAEPDAPTSAVAHRLGIDVAPAPRADAPAVFDASSLSASVNGAEVGAQAIVAHTVAAQIRLLTSKDPDLQAMRQACG